jgi:hypothetical protein
MILDHTRLRGRDIHSKVRKGRLEFLRMEGMLDITKQPVDVFAGHSRAPALDFIEFPVLSSLHVQGVNLGCRFTLLNCDFHSGACGFLSGQS